MYTIFKENRVRVPFDEIMERYRGKWVFLVNLEGDLFEYNEEEDGMEPCDPISAEVLVVADKAYEGHETGIYMDLREHPERYGNITEMDCRDGSILSTYNVLIEAGVPVE